MNVHKIFTNGDVYDGSLLDKKPNGVGVMKYNNGNIYYGEWKEGIIKGGGMIKYTNGDIYYGNWKEGDKYGRGIMIFANTDVYEGNWNDNKMHGNGKMTYANGDIYEGNWNNNKMHGKGIMTYANGDINDGEWKDNKFINYDIKKPDHIKSVEIKDQTKFGTCFAYSGSRNFVRTLQILNIIESEYVEQFFLAFYVVLTNNFSCNGGGSEYVLNFLYNYIKNNYSTGLFTLTYADINCYEQTDEIHEKDKLILQLPLDKKNQFISDMEYLFTNNLLFVARQVYQADETKPNKPTKAIKTMLYFRLQPFVAFYISSYLLTYMINKQTDPLIPSSLITIDFSCAINPNGTETGTGTGTGTETFLGHAVNLRKWTTNKIEFKNSWGKNVGDQGNFSVHDLKYLICQTSEKKYTEIIFCSLMFDYNKLNNKFKQRVNDKLCTYWKTYDNKLETVENPNYLYKLDEYGFANGIGIENNEFYKYEGELKHGVYDGHGVMTFDNKDIYSGEWKDGQENGRGIYTYVNGDIYSGEWKDGLYNGKGIQTNVNGEIYNGEWKDEIYNGNGVKTYANGDEYDGEWKNGLYNGKGVKTYANGDKYNGEWKNGLYNGFGKIKYTDCVGENAICEYVGKWENGLYNGGGVITYANGNKYSSQWLKGDQIGQKLPVAFGNVNFKNKYIKYKQKYINLSNKQHNNKL